MATYTDIHQKVVKETINVNYTDRVTTQQVKLHNLSNEYWGILSGTIKGDISAADIVGCRIVDSTVDGLSVATLAAEMTRYRGTLYHKETHDLSAFIWWNLRERPSSEHNLKYGDLFKLDVGQYGLSTYQKPEIILDLGENDFFILNKTLSAIEDIQVSDLDVFRNSESEVSAIEKTVAELATKVDSLSGNVEALSTHVSTLSSRVDVLSTDVSTLSGNVEVLSTDVSTLSGNVEVLSTDVSTLSGNVEVLSTHVSTLSSRVDVLSTDVSTLSSDLQDLSTTVDEKLFVKDYVDPELSANTYKQLSVIHVKASAFDKNVMTGKCPPNVLQIVDSGCMNAEGQVLSNLMMPEDGEDFKRISVGATKRYVDEKDVALCAAISAISSDSPMIGELSAAIKHKVYVVDPEAAEEHKAHYTDLSVIKLTQDEYDSLVAYENPILSNGNILYVISSDINDAHGKVISNLVMPLSGTEDFEGVAATDKYVLKMINDKGNLSDIMNVISAVSSDLSSAISTDVKNLATNYYKKTETYNKTEVDSSMSRMQTALNQLNATVTADVQNLATNYYKKTDVYTKGEANQISSSLSTTVQTQYATKSLLNSVSSSLSTTVQTQYTKKSEVSTISATLSSKIDSVMTVDDQLQHAIGHELSVIKLPLSAYEQLAYRGKCLSNALYIVSSDVLDAQGQVISNLMMPEDGEDFERADVAVTKRYANERLSSVSGDVLSAVDAKISTSLSGMMTDPILSSLHNLRNLEDVLSAITFIADRFGGTQS